MASSSLSDIAHLDPCRRCGDLHLRADMTPAKRFRSYGPKARGMVCDLCKMALEGIRVFPPAHQPPA